MNAPRHKYFMTSLFAALLVLFFSFASIVSAAYVMGRRADITSPVERFISGASVRGTYALDSQVALDKTGHLWIWGYYGYCSIGNAGQSGSSSPNPVNGASYTLDPINTGFQNDCIRDSDYFNNKPAMIKGANGFVSVAASAYSMMAVDKKGNLYGWGDNTPGGSPAPSSGSLKDSGWTAATLVSGGVYGLHKDGTAPPEALPNKINQLNPQESDATWKPIDGPDAPLPPASGKGSYEDGFNKGKVLDVASNEYAYAYLKDDGTVWSVGYNNFGQRGVGKRGPVGSWGTLRNGTTGYPFDATGGVSSVPTKVAFPEGVKIKYIGDSYEGYHAIDTDNNVWYWGRSFTGNAGLSSAELLANSSTDGSQPCQTLSTSESYCYAPIQVPALTKVVKENGFSKFAEGYQFGVLLDEHKKVWIWGSSANKVGMPDSEANSNAVWQSEPSVFTATTNTGKVFTADNIVDINGGFHAGQMVTEDGYLYAWGEAYLGGAHMADLSPTSNASPWNSGHRVGIVWDPTLDPQHRKVVAVGGNKDGANANLDDGTIYSWGENGGGAALGGRGYLGRTVCTEGLPGCVSPKISMVGNRAQGGLYVWPATFVPDIQNVGRYLTVTKNSYPFEGSAVKNGEVVEYTLKIDNDRSSYRNRNIRIEDEWGASAELVPGSFKAKYTISDGRAVDSDADGQWDISSQFDVGSTGFASTDRQMMLSPQSTLIIKYQVKVTGSSGSVGGKASIINLANGSEIDSEKISNPIAQ